jgi:ubiquinone/menaquinone biosynthesis C-methylase UbiE
LDAGCGTGDWILSLNRPEVNQFIGFDLDLKRVKRAKKRNRLENVDVLRADISCIPLQSQIFDIIICNVVFMYLVDEKSALSELRRVLTKGGVLYVSHAGFGHYLKCALRGRGRAWIALVVSTAIFLLGRNHCVILSLETIIRRHTVFTYETMGAWQAMSRFQRLLKESGFHVIRTKSSHFSVFPEYLHFLARR